MTLFQAYCGPLYTSSLVQIKKSELEKLYRRIQ